jgi:2,4-dienoyl-CoA reductase-like NADH-dependent reductase (Old Yellow Enzyme family)
MRSELHLMQAEESDVEAPVFRPGKLGPLTLRNRVIKAATFEGMTPEGLVTDELVDFHRRVAAGGVGMTTVAYLAVAPEGRTHAQQIHMREEAVPGLRLLTDAVHQAGCAAAAQIGHARSGRQSSLQRLGELGAVEVVQPARSAPEPRRQ